MVEHGRGCCTLEGNLLLKKEDESIVDHDLYDTAGLQLQLLLKEGWVSHRHCREEVLPSISNLDQDRSLENVVLKHRQRTTYAFHDLL